jgi:hypothetical protein
MNTLASDVANITRYKISKYFFFVSTISTLALVPPDNFVVYRPKNN